MGVLRYWESVLLLKSVLLLVGEGTCIRRQRDIRNCGDIVLYVKYCVA